MSESPHPDGGISAVVAAYRPDGSIIDNVRRLAEQVGAVIVVDDGSGDASSRVFTALEGLPGKQVEVLHLSENTGIAAALNAGVTRALGNGASAVLTMDQDTAIGNGYIAAATHAIDRLELAGRPFAAIAAGMQSGRVVRPVHFADRGDAITPTLEAIQSGLLIPRATFTTVGMFDESLFIDCVDTDFVIRAAAKGLPTYLARGCSITHPLGEEIETGIRTTRSGRSAFAFHPPWRRYYISRNRAVMLGRYGLREPVWALVSLAGETVQLLRSLLFGPDKLRQCSAVLLGVIDALLGNRGRLAGPASSLLGRSR